MKQRNLSFRLIPAHFRLDSGQPAGPIPFDGSFSGYSVTLSQARGTSECMTNHS